MKRPMRKPDIYDVVIGFGFAWWMFAFFFIL